MSNRVDFESAPYRPTDAFFADEYEDEIASESGTKRFDTGRTLSREQLVSARQRVLDVINDALSVLTDFERDIIKLRFGLSHGYALQHNEVAWLVSREANICSETIRKACKRAFLKLQNTQIAANVLRVLQDADREFLDAATGFREKIDDICDRY